MREKTKAQRRPIAVIVALTVFAVMLFGFGALGAHIGWRAIAERHYLMEWRERYGFGFGAFNAPGPAAQHAKGFEGGDAVRFGAGLIAGSAFLMIGAIAIVFSGSFGSWFFRFLAGCSFLCLLVAMGCFFPPWQLLSIPFFVVVALILLPILVFPGDRRKGWRNWVFSWIIPAGIVIGFIKSDIAFAMAMGLFAGVGILAHTFALWPHWKRFK